MSMARTSIAIALAAGFAHAEPVEVFGGEFAISDSLEGLAIDVDADGFLDVRFAYHGISVNSVFGWNGWVQQANSTSDALFATTLDANDQLVHHRFNSAEPIGPAQVTGLGFGNVAYEFFMDGTSGGPWLDQEPGYLAFSFLSAGARHYGWAEIEIDNADNTDDGFLVLYRIGYETTPNTPISAGAPLGCSPADLAAPFGALNFFDISTFITLFNAGDPGADFAAPFGSLNFFDVAEYITLFNAGCP